MVVVVMFEPAHPQENLTLTEQVNEVFGPFENSEEAERWTERMSHIKNRLWLIIPLSSPNVVKDLDFGRN